jgi:hypothetical protein
LKEKINAIEQIKGNTYKLEMAKRKRKRAKEDKRHGKHLYSL